MSIYRPNLFKGRTALVTGGGTGIGYEISRELLLLGANVVICSRKVEVLKAAAERLRSEVGSGEGGRCQYCTVNTRDEKSIKEAFDFAVSKFGTLNYVVNNAGGQYPSLASGISPNGWRSVIDLNLNGTFLCSKEAYEVFTRQNTGGAIVNITCDMENGFPLMSHTGAARAGVVNLTKSLAVEWASCGIRVNCVSPGVIYSESADSHYKSQTTMPDVLQMAVPGIPANRLGTVSEISSSVVFLLSDGASYVTGVNLQVDGGSRLMGPAPNTRELVLG